MLKICVIGLGYVGLPICIKLAKKYKIVGFDINSERINSLKKGTDLNDEFKKKDLKKKNLFFSKNILIFSHLSKIAETYSANQL